MPTVGPFSNDALEMNRSGQLSHAQVRHFRGVARSRRSGVVSGAFLAFAIGLVIALFADNTTPFSRIAIPAVCFIVAAGLMVWAVLGSDALSRDIRAGRVESVEGAFLKGAQTSGATSRGNRYYLQAQGRRYKVSRAEYEMLPRAGVARIFFLPHYRRVVNFEQLPDLPLPKGFTPTLGGVLSTLKDSFWSTRRTDREQAAARLAGMEHSIRQTNAAPPPAEQRDVRPLAEAVLGSWTTGLLTLTFEAGGVVSGALPGGRKAIGHWHVSEDGKLHSDIMGDDESAEAWVAGDKLTVSRPGEIAMTFTRT